MRGVCNVTASHTSRQPGWITTLGVILLLFAIPSRAQSPKQIQDKLAAIDKEVDRLRQTDPKAHPYAKAYADDLAKRAQRVRDEWAGKPDPDATDPELHVIGVYEGTFPDGPRRYGVAAARVEDTQRPIILALCAFRAVRWKLEIADGVKIQKIILAGIKDQVIETPPAGIEIEKHTSDGGSRHYFYVYSREGDGAGSYAEAAGALKALTGLPISTVVARYRYDGKPLVIGRNNAEWVAQSVMTRLEPLYLEATANERARQRQALAGIRFSALYRTTAGVQMKSDVAQFTIDGPIESSLRTLPLAVAHVAIDPRGPTYYGLSRNLVRIDIKANTVTDLPADGDFPEMEIPCAAAFDSKRNRVIVATLGGEGFMYAYDATKGQWSLMRSMYGIDLHCLTYSAEEDCFTAWHTNTAEMDRS
jgi:hypothetical protein